MSEVRSSSITATDVTINSEGYDHSTGIGTSSIVTKAITNYPFVVPGESTNGVVVHRSKKYIAYSLNSKLAGSCFLNALIFSMPIYLRISIAEIEIYTIYQLQVAIY